MVDDKGGDDIRHVYPCPSFTSVKRGRRSRRRSLLDRVDAACRAVVGVSVRNGTPRSPSRTSQACIAWVCGPRAPVLRTLAAAVVAACPCRHPVMAGSRCGSYEGVCGGLRGSRDDGLGLLAARPDRRVYTHAGVVGSPSAASPPPWLGRRVAASAGSARAHSRERASVGVGVGVREGVRQRGVPGARRWSARVSRAPR